MFRSLANRTFQPRSLALVCCPQPYKPCSLRERIKGCDALVAPHLAVRDTGALGVAEALARLQRARGALVEGGGKKCGALAPASPPAACGPPPNRPKGAYNRSDLLCEMLTWQSEELGDGNRDEYRIHDCPWGGVAKGRDDRKGGRLHMSELPSWALLVVQNTARAKGRARRNKSKAGAN